MPDVWRPCLRVLAKPYSASKMKSTIFSMNSGHVTIKSTIPGLTFRLSLVDVGLAQVKLAGGRTRYTFHSPIARWSIYNNFVPLFVTFDPSHATSTGGGAGGATAADAAELSVLIHVDVGDADATPLSSWQTLRALCVATPQLPLPKQLVTSITWSDEDFFLDEVDQPEDGPDSFVAMYRRLGFNTMPKKSMPRMFESWAGRSINNDSVTPIAVVEKFPHLAPRPRWSQRTELGRDALRA